MPEYLHPGVYVQEESSGAKPIEAAGTSTACFVGETSRGRPNYPTFVTSWLQFERLFGTFDKERHLPLAVYHFFLNGGRRAYILRVLPSTTFNEDGSVDRQGAVAATATMTIGGATKALSIVAAGAGRWAENIQISVTQNKYNRALTDWRIFQLNADNKREDLEVFQGFGGKESGDKFYAALINRDSSYIRIEPDSSGMFPEWDTPTVPTTATPPVGTAAAAAAADEPAELAKAT
ncbi:MAG TPA: hypothetical protein VIV60_32385, partial [Polyangiaceae bacterium]